MHENEFLFKLIDRFHGWELVELLDIPVEDIIEYFYNRIEDNREELEEIMTNGR